jgi:hypothetical protein
MQDGMAEWGTDRQPRPIDEQAHRWAVRHLRDRVTFGRDDVARILADLELLMRLLLVLAHSWRSLAPSPVGQGRDCKGRSSGKGGQGQ